MKTTKITKSSSERNKTVVKLRSLGKLRDRIIVGECKRYSRKTMNCTNNATTAMSQNNDNEKHREVANLEEKGKVANTQP